MYNNVDLQNRPEDYEDSIMYEMIVLREQTAVLHPEHLYNAMDHHYEMMRIISIIILYYAHLYYFILCIKLLHTLYADTFSYTVYTVAKTVNSLHKLLYSNSVHE